MNPIIVTYIGFVVAILILMWAAIELIRRYSGYRKVNTKKTPNNWVTLKPTLTDVAEERLPQADATDAEERAAADLHKRAKQNGRYSQSKKSL